MAARFFLVSYLPTYVSLVFLLVLSWAVYGPGTSFKRAWKVASALTVTQIVVLVLLVMVVALLLMPFQLQFVRLLEGAWPGRRGVRWQQGRKADLARLAVPKSDDAADMWLAGVAGIKLRQRFPIPEHLVKATSLGNIMAATEDRAGRDYGLDAVVAWPRLYPLLGAEVKAIVDDRRNTLDSMTRFAVTAVITAVASVVILRDAGCWLLLVAAPLGLSWLAYLAAMQAAIAFGESVQAAFDLHHLSFGTTFGVAPPASAKAEHESYRQLCDLWRQSIPASFPYAATEPAAADKKTGGKE